MEIEVMKLGFKYSGTDEFALQDVSLKIESGEFVLITGRSGSGKSTFLRAINSLIPNFYGGEYLGKVLVSGKNPACTPTRDMAHVVGTVLQDPENQILMSTVEREIAFGLENSGLGVSIITRRIEEALDLLDIADIRHRKIVSLSGGEKQKVAIAAAMARHPRILVLDEPTSQLDPKSAENILATLRRINEDLGITVLIAEHRTKTTMHIADRLLVFNDGSLEGDGEPRLIAQKLDLDALGVGYPPVARVARHYGLPHIPLTVKEAQKILNLNINAMSIGEEERKRSDAVVEVKNLKFSYNKRAAINNLSFKLYKNEIFGIIGRNGSGKSTLAKLIAGIIKPKGGRITYKVPKNEIGLVFQNPNLHIIGNSVFEDIAYTIRARGEKDAELKSKEVMKYLGIEHLANRNPMDLSGGEKLLFAMATVLVFNPKVLILDEPTRGLSWDMKKKLVKLLRAYTQHGSVILISHDVELMARLADRVALMSQGNFALVGQRRDMLASTLTFSTQLNKLAQRIGDAESKILIEEDLGVPV